jgi:hypothetical protein
MYSVYQALAICIDWKRKLVRILFFNSLENQSPVNIWRLIFHSESSLKLNLIALS